MSISANCDSPSFSSRFVYWLLQCLDGYRATVYRPNPQFMSVDQTHANKRVGVGGVGLHSSCLTVPDHRCRVHVEHLRTAVAKKCLFTTVPSKTKQGDECGRQCQEAGETGVNDGFDLVLLPVRAAYDKADGRLTVRVNDADNHAGSATRRGPKRCTARWPIRTNPGRAFG